MEAATLKDYRATHNFLSALYSQYQGLFVQQSLLIRFQHSEAMPEAIEEIKKILDQITTWKQALYKEHTVLVRADGQTDFPDILEVGLEFMQVIFDRLIPLGGDVQERLSREVPLQDRKEDIAFLIASYAWCLYAFDHSIQSILQFAEEFDDEEMKGLGEQHHDECLHYLETIAWLERDFEERDSFDQEFCDRFVPLVSKLPEGMVKETIRSLAAVMQSLGKDPWNENADAMISKQKDNLQKD